MLVRLTDAGSEVLERLRARFRTVLHDELADLDDEEVETLAAAVGILDRMIARFGSAPR